MIEAPVFGAPNPDGFAAWRAAQPSFDGLQPGDPLYHELYDRYRIPDSALNQIRGFTDNGTRIVYQGQIRSVMADLGMAAPRIKLDDPALLQRIDAWSNKVAVGTQATYNRYLDRALQKGVPVDEFLADVRNYNDQTLLPYTYNTATQWAREDFIKNNGLVVTWSVGPETAVCDDCITLIANQPYSQEDWDGLESPPLHQNCLAAGSLVTACSVHAVFTRTYEGPVVTIRTAGGQQLTGTPNHPVLTPEGWVTLGSLQEGRHVLSSGGGIERATAPLVAELGLDNPHEFNVPTPIEQIRAASPVAFRHVPVAPADFHGDGAGTTDAEGYVHIEGSYRPFSHPAEPEIPDRGRQAEGVQATPPLRFEAPLCAFHAGRFGVPSAPASSMGGSRVALQPRDAAGDQPAPQQFVAYAGLFSEPLDRLPGQIALDQIVEIRQVHERRQVYNLQTAEAWYTANSIIVGNCMHQGYPNVDPTSLPDPNNVWTGDSSTGVGIPLPDLEMAAQDAGYASQALAQEPSLNPLSTEEAPDDTETAFKQSSVIANLTPADQAPVPIVAPDLAGHPPSIPHDPLNAGDIHQALSDHIDRVIARWGKDGAAADPSLYAAHRVTGARQDVERMRADLERTANKMGYQVEYEQSKNMLDTAADAVTAQYSFWRNLPDARGYIQVNSEMTDARQVNALAHEVAHIQYAETAHGGEILGTGTYMTDFPDRLQVEEELRADLSAWALSQHYGLDASLDNYAFLTDWIPTDKRADVAGWLQADTFQASTTDTVQSIIDRAATLPAPELGIPVPVMPASTTIIPVGRGPPDLAVPTLEPIAKAQTHLSFDSGWTQIGQQGGSNAGGLFQAPDGARWYVKAPVDAAHAQNEVLANDLYARMGIAAPDVRLIDLHGKWGKETGVASRIVDNTGTIGQHWADVTDAQRAQIREGFGPDAWLANWDVAGMGLDNMVIGTDGQIYRIDNGGSLLYRAQGGAKGSAFGDKVSETQTLINGSNHSTAKVFNGLTEEEKLASVQRVANLTHQDITEAVHDAFGTGPQADQLVAKLEARRQDLIDQFPVKPDVVEAPATEPAIAHLTPEITSAPLPDLPTVVTGTYGPNNKPVSKEVAGHTFTWNADKQSYQFQKTGSKMALSFTPDAPSVVDQVIAAQAGAPLALETAPAHLEDVTSVAAAPEVTTGKELVLGPGWTQYAEGEGGNPGAFYTDPDGTKWYVKAAQSTLHAQDEVLANDLYAAAGIAVPDVRTIDLQGKWGTDVGIASRIVDTQGFLRDEFDHLTAEQIAQARQGYGMDSWLANWDVLGVGPKSSGRNMVLGTDGVLYRIDNGGAMLFGGLGGPKGAGFGTHVTELQKFLDPATQKWASKLNAGMTDAEKKASVQRVVNFTHDQISGAVYDAMGHTQTADDLITKLEARQADMAEQMGLHVPGAAPAPVAAPVTHVVAAAIPLNPALATLPQTPAEWEARRQAVKTIVAQSKSSEELYDMLVGANGKYTAARQAQQQQLLDQLWHDLGASVPNDHQAIMAGGLGGAGKTTLLEKEPGQLLGVELGPDGHVKNFMTINADDIKAAMLQAGLYDAPGGLQPLEAASLVHRESRYLAQQLMDRAIAEGKNFTLETTMAGASQAAKIAQMKAAGYDVRGLYADVSAQHAQQAAIQRWEDGVKEYFAGTNPLGGRFGAAAGGQVSGGAANLQNFKHLEGNFSHFVVVDNEGYAAKITEVGGTEAPAAIEPVHELEQAPVAGGMEAAFEPGAWNEPFVLEPPPEAGPEEQPHVFGTPAEQAALLEEPTPEIPANITGYYAGKPTVKAVDQHTFNWNEDKQSYQFQKDGSKMKLSFQPDDPELLNKVILDKAGYLPGEVQAAGHTVESFVKAGLPPLPTTPPAEDLQAKADKQAVLNTLKTQYETGVLDQGQYLGQLAAQDVSYTNDAHGIHVTTPGFETSAQPLPKSITGTYANKPTTKDVSTHTFSYNSATGKYQFQKDGSKMKLSFVPDDPAAVDKVIAAQGADGSIAAVETAAPGSTLTAGQYGVQTGTTGLNNIAITKDGQVLGQLSPAQWLDVVKDIPDTLPLTDQQFQDALAKAAADHPVYVPPPPAAPKYTLAQEAGQKYGVLEDGNKIATGIPSDQVNTVLDPLLHLPSDGPEYQAGLKSLADQAPMPGGHMDYEPAAGDNWTITKDGQPVAEVGSHDLLDAKTGFTDWNTPAGQQALTQLATDHPLEVKEPYYSSITDLGTDTVTITKDAEPIATVQTSDYLAQITNLPAHASESGAEWQAALQKLAEEAPAEAKPAEEISPELKGYHLVDQPDGSFAIYHNGQLLQEMVQQEDLDAAGITYGGPSGYQHDVATFVQNNSISVAVDQPHWMYTHDINTDNVDIYRDGKLIAKTDGGELQSLAEEFGGQNVADPGFQLALKAMAEQAPELPVVAEEPKVVEAVHEYAFKNPGGGAPIDLTVDGQKVAEVPLSTFQAAVHDLQPTGAFSWKDPEAQAVLKDLVDQAPAAPAAIEDASHGVRIVAGTDGWEVIKDIPGGGTQTVATLTDEQNDKLPWGVHLTDSPEFQQAVYETLTDAQKADVATIEAGGTITPAPAAAPATAAVVPPPDALTFGSPNEDTEMVPIYDHAGNEVAEAHMDAFSNELIEAAGTADVYAPEMQAELKTLAGEYTPISDIPDVLQGVQDHLPAGYELKSQGNGIWKVAATYAGDDAVGIAQIDTLAPGGQIAVTKTVPLPGSAFDHALDALTGAAPVDPLPAAAAPTGYTIDYSGNGELYNIHKAGSDDAVGMVTATDLINAGYNTPGQIDDPAIQQLLASHEVQPVAAAVVPTPPPTVSLPTHITGTYGPNAKAVSKDVAGHTFAWNPDKQSYTFQKDGSKMALSFTPDNPHEIDQVIAAQTQGAIATAPAASPAVAAGIPPGAELSIDSTTTDGKIHILANGNEVAVVEPSDFGAALGHLTNPDPTSPAYQQMLHELAGAPAPAPAALPHYTIQPSTGPNDFGYDILANGQVVAHDVGPDLIPFNTELPENQQALHQIVTQGYVPTVAAPAAAAAPAADTIAQELAQAYADSQTPDDADYVKVVQDAYAAGQLSPTAVKWMLDNPWAIDNFALGSIDATTVEQAAATAAAAPAAAAAPVAPKYSTEWLGGDVYQITEAATGQVVVPEVMGSDLLGLNSATAEGQANLEKIVAGATPEAGTAPAALEPNWGMPHLITGTTQMGEHVSETAAAKFYGQYAGGVNTGKYYFSDTKTGSKTLFTPDVPEALDKIIAAQKDGLTPEQIADLPTQISGTTQYGGGHKTYDLAGGHPPAGVGIDPQGNYFFKWSAPNTKTGIIFYPDNVAEFDKLVFAQKFGGIYPPQVGYKIQQAHDAQAAQALGAIPKVVDPAKGPLEFNIDYDSGTYHFTQNGAPVPGSLTTAEYQAISTASTAGSVYDASFQQSIADALNTKLALQAQGDIALGIPASPPDTLLKAETAPGGAPHIGIPQAGDVYQAPSYYTNLQQAGLPIPANASVAPTPTTVTATPIPAPVATHTPADSLGTVAIPYLKDIPTVDASLAVVESLPAETAQVFGQTAVDLDGPARQAAAARLAGIPGADAGFIPASAVEEVKAVYDATQAALRAQNVDTVMVYRILPKDSPSLTQFSGKMPHTNMQTANYKAAQPAERWYANAAQAKADAGPDSYIAWARVDANRILSVTNTYDQPAYYVMGTDLKVGVRDTAHFSPRQLDVRLPQGVVSLDPAKLPQDMSLSNTKGVQVMETRNDSSREDFRRRVEENLRKMANDQGYTGAGMRNRRGDAAIAQAGAMNARQYLPEGMTVTDDKLMEVQSDMAGNWSGDSTGPYWSAVQQQGAHELWGLGLNQGTAASIRGKMNTPSWSSDVAIAKAIMLAQRDAVQAAVRMTGQDYVVLARGMSISSDPDWANMARGNYAKTMVTNSQPLNSFSNRRSTANKFFGSHLLMARVPVDRIIGEHSMGYGLEEAEWVVLDGDFEMTVLRK